MARWQGFGPPKPRHPFPWDGYVRWPVFTPAQSYPQTLRVAAGLLLRILYWTATDVRVASRPGASFSAVCPPDFTTPTFVMVSSFLPFQRRTTFVTSTAAPSTEIFVFLMSSFHNFPASALISALGSMDLTTFSLSTNHSSALALPRVTSKTADARPTPLPRYPTFIVLLSFLIPVSRRSLRLPLDPSCTAVGLSVI